MQIPYPNAFTINKLNSGAFPFSAAPKQWNDLNTINIFPLRICDIADIIAEYAQQYCYLFDVNNFWLNDTGERFLTMREIAARREVSCHSFGDDIVAIERDQLVKLIGDWGHYEFHLFEAPQLFSEDEMIANYFSYFDHKMDTPLFPPLLKTVSIASIYLHSHDDCYLYVETRELALLKAILARALQIYTGTIIISNFGSEPEIPSLPVDLLEMLWPLDGAFTIFSDETIVTDDRVEIGYSDKKFDFQDEQDYPIIGQLQYDIKSHEWQLA